MEGGLVPSIACFHTTVSVSDRDAGLYHMLVCITYTICTICVNIQHIRTVLMYYSIQYVLYLDQHILLELAKYIHNAPLCKDYPSLETTTVWLLSGLYRQVLLT